jgi:hypothetical protein
MKRAHKTAIGRVLRVEDKNTVGDFAAKRLEELGGG